ncbi:di-trans,poly-cis-decaprenylcistransferase [Candidatus Woesearchaeota archaeon]|nr:di-trans,poly-cis-decaprenylcistransferase [Candidatus Woesearchaeota archaeon]
MGDRFHVGIILDGNRRYAEREKMKPWMGHHYGARNLSELIRKCKHLPISQLTLYCFSMENFDRSAKEKKELFKLIRKHFAKLEDSPRINDIRLNFIGRLELFPKDMQELMRRLMRKTKKHTHYTVTFAMGYGGRQEIVDSVKKIIKKKIKKIDEETIAKHLYMQDEPDLIIRPGGEKRTSNFLMWQSAYSEWIFIPKLWPEFSERDMERALEMYRKRKRRFGT